MLRLKNKPYPLQQHLILLLSVCFIFLTTSLCHFFASGYEQHSTYHFSLATDSSESRRESEEYDYATSAQSHSDAHHQLVLISPPSAPSLRFIDESETNPAKAPFYRAQSVTKNWRKEAQKAVAIPATQYRSYASNAHRLGGWKESNVHYKILSISSLPS
ncbi:hypothetical protein [Photobacterium minamisatsumaniensis]|uniref:hypothetical protein n=1 Tax=Photobacterium minamisatsumaniensis TaxID=2910233 RepID=UPI003D0F8E3B